MIGVYPFKDYEGFKELFVREDGRRKNAVLLSWLTSKEMRAWLIENGHKDYLLIRDMGTLKDSVMYLVSRYSTEGYRPINLLGYWYGSSEYYTDSMDGICEDRDYKSYRYCRREDNRVFKMKAGRLYRRLIDDSRVGHVIPESVKLWICEEVQRAWESHARTILPPPDALRLHVNDDFARIYNSRYLKGGFGSCMTDEDHHPFYTNSVKAKAAYLENTDGKILARCVIFTEVKDDETGEIVRIAERQYASDNKDCLRYDLINQLIEGGHIDGYKKIGAGCGEASSILSKDGESWSHRKFSIECNVADDEVISYQDSFKWLDTDAHRAYNYSHRNANERLDTTDMYLRGSNWDEYHEEYTSSDVVSVWYEGRWIDCSEDRLDDFIYIDDEGYIHESECVECPECGCWMWDRYGEHSDLTEEYYCCYSCLEDAERNYKVENWHYAEYDDDYFEDEDSIKTYKRGSGDEITIYEDTAEQLVSDGEALLIDGIYYSIEYVREALRNY